MSRDNPQHRSSTLREYTERYCDGTLSAEQTAELERHLRDDPLALDSFVLYMEVHSRIAWNARAHAEDEKGRPPEKRDERRGVRDEGRGVVGSQGMAGSPVIDVSVGAAVQLPHQTDIESKISNPPFPSLSTTRYPLSTSFVGGPVFSYMVATVILGVMLLSAWAYKITHYHQIAEAPSASSSDRPELVFVGRITGMVDCRWSDPQTEAYAWASVPLGRKYALASGLMKITYTTGAKVILQGPCTYEVESSSGGYLALGKLTAKVVSGQWSVVSGQKPEVRGQRSDHYPLSTIHYPLFSVRTPTAIVTDLGTEFGVEVDKTGNTVSHVFQGSVKVQVVVPEKGTGPICRNGPEGASHKLDLSPFPAVVLRANESARVEKGKGAGDVRLVLPDEISSPPKFVRRIVKPLRELDLLDIVAGGNGTGNRRERGVDPASGIRHLFFPARKCVGDRRYRPVAWHKLIDGVFVPGGDDGSVQLDSAGHVFDAFPCACGESWGSIWARAAEVQPDRRTKDKDYWIYALGSAERFMPDGRGLLAMHANAGITFDLEAIRRVNSDVTPRTFRAVVGMGDVRRLTGITGPSLLDPTADVWVFVDGRLEFKREKLRPLDGLVKVNIKLGPTDRFLTLVSTDGGTRVPDPIGGDWVVFGDPVLETTSTASEKMEK